MGRVGKCFAFFLVSAFSLGSLGYVALQAVLPHGTVFSGWYRMFMYHAEHPFQYIAVVAFIYACLATFCAVWAGRPRGCRGALVIFAVMLATVLIASVPGGVLWKIHDMRAGYFPEGRIFWDDLLWGASTGLQVGWLVIASSVPYNLIGLILGYVVTDRGFNLGVPRLSR